MEEKMNIDDIMDFLEGNLKALEKLYINFETEFLEVASFDVVEYVCKYYDRKQRIEIVKELLNYL